MVGKKAVLMFVLLSLGLVAASFHPTQSVKSATIDFSGLAEGAIVSSLRHGAGISGDLIEGSVSVRGYNPDFPPGTNTAMIFDATCAGGCSGQDFDLHFPELGNGLIISEDLDSTDPDDADNPGAFFRFDFSFGNAKVNVESLIVADVDEATGVIKLFKGVTLLKTMPFPPTGDHQYVEVQVNINDIDRMEVYLNGSGMIDNVEIVIEEPNNGPKITLDLNGKCEPYENERSEDLRLTGSLKRDGSPVPNHAISLDLPGGNKVSVNTKQDGAYSYLFEGARNYIGQVITARATVDGKALSKQHKITETDFAPQECNPPAISLELDGKCEPYENKRSDDLRLWGNLTLGGDPLPKHTIRLDFPDGNSVSLNTDTNGEFRHIYKGARNYIGQNVTAEATVDGRRYTDTHPITEDDFDFIECRRITGPKLTVQGICEKKPGQSESHDLDITGKLTDSDESPVPNHTIELDLPDREELVFVTTNDKGNYSYLFEGADQYLGKRVKAETTFEGERIFPEVDHIITAADFEGCKPKQQYECKKVKLTTYHRQPIELGSQIPGWGLEDVNLECVGRGQGKSCRLVVKGQPGYLIKSDTLKMNVPRLEPHVKYQAQIKGYDGAWTNKGCEFSFITGGRVASTSTHLADQVDQLGWVSLGEGQKAIKPLGVCSGWSDACLFAENIIGFHLDDIYGKRQPGAELSALQPGDRISIYRDHRLYTYEFTGSERVRQSAEGNQSILDAAELHDLVLTTCSGYWLIDEGHFSHTRLATFTLLPRIERLYLGH